jgi:glycosyltransferase involved in cell wall biosynthesis
MRILYILTSLGVGGAEKQVVDLADRMSAKGHVLAFLILKHSAEEWPVNLPVLRLNLARSPISIIRGLRFARNFVVLFQPELLHSHTFPANLFTRLMRIGLRIKGRAPAAINTIHNVYEGGWHRMLAYAITNSLVDRVTAVSTPAAERFVRLQAVPRKKMSVITNGIDIDKFAPDPKRRKIVRNQMRAGSSFLWLAVGRLAPAKDYPNLLRAFHALLQSEPDSKLWIAGEGDPTALLASYPDLLRPNPSIQWLGLRRDIADLLDAADGFVLSSAWEGMPLVIGEAMSKRKPVVATNVGGVSELMGDTGTLVPSADSHALTAAMLSVMKNDELQRKRSALAAQERIVTHFSMQARAEQWEAFYLESLVRRFHA